MNVMEHHESSILTSEEALWRQDDEHEFYKMPALERTPSQSSMLTSEEALWRQGDEHKFYKKPPLERTTSLFALGAPTDSSENVTISKWKTTMTFPWKIEKGDKEPRQCHISPGPLSSDVEQNVPSQANSERSCGLQEHPLSFLTSMHQRNNLSRDSGVRPRRRQLRRASSSFMWQDYSTSFLRLTIEGGPRHNYREMNTRLGKILSSIHRVYRTNEFVILIIISILCAKAYPPLGAKYVYPRITSSWIVVVFIFFLAGLGLKTEEFAKAFQRLKFNSFVQFYSFGIISCWMYGVSRGLVAIGVLAQPLADGMVMCSCLPQTISSVAVLTKAAGGDEASAIFNSAFANMNGVFLSPILMLGYLGVSGETNFIEIFYKVSLRVVTPVLVGQICRRTSLRIVQFAKKHRHQLRRVQQYSLIFLVYTVFCLTFEDARDSNLSDIVVMVFAQLFLFSCFQAIAWACLKVLFPNEPKLRVMGLFGCTQKTVAMGVPLIGAIYENDPNVGLYTLPLLIYYPLQLLVGAFLVPRLRDFVKEEKERLGILDYDSETDDGNSRKDACTMSENQNEVYEWNLEELKQNEWLSEEKLSNETLKMNKPNDESETETDSVSDSDSEKEKEPRKAASNFNRLAKIETGPQLSNIPTGILRVATEPELCDSVTKKKLFVRFSEILTEEFTIMGENLDEPVVGQELSQVEKNKTEIKRRKKTAKSGRVKKKRTKKKKSKLSAKKSSVLLNAEKIDGLQLKNKLRPKAQPKSGLGDVDDRPTIAYELVQNSIQEKVESQTLYPEIIEIEKMLVSDTCCEGFDGLSDLEDFSTSSSYKEIV